LTVLLSFRKRTTPGIAEEIRAFAEGKGVARLKDGRAWGPVFKRAETLGVIKGVGYAPTTAAPKSFGGWSGLIANRVDHLSAGYREGPRTDERAACAASLNTRQIAAHSFVGPALHESQCRSSNIVPVAVDRQPAAT